MFDWFYLSCWLRTDTVMQLSFYCMYVMICLHDGVLRLRQESQCCKSPSGHFEALKASKWILVRALHVFSEYFGSREANLVSAKCHTCDYCRSAEAKPSDGAPNEAAQSQTTGQTLQAENLSEHRTTGEESTSQVAVLTGCTSCLEPLSKQLTCSLVSKQSLG